MKSTATQSKVKQLHSTTLVITAMTRDSLVVMASGEPFVKLGKMLSGIAKVESKVVLVGMR